MLGETEKSSGVGRTASELLISLLGDHTQTLYSVNFNY